MQESFADRGELADFAHGVVETALHQIGRCIEHKAAQHAGHAVDLGLIGGIAGSVFGAEFCDLALGAALTQGKF